MEIRPLPSEFFPNRGRESEYARKKANYMLDMLVINKEVEEAFIDAENEIDPTKVHSEYTQRLLDLHEKLDAKGNSFGHRMAENINARVENLGPFTAIHLINFVLKNLEKSPEEIEQIPEIIETIKGNNGRDSRLLRYYFVSKVLPEHEIQDAEQLRALAERYAQDAVQKLPKPTEEAEKYNRVCKSMYKGDFNDMRSEFRAAVRDRLESVIKTAKTISDAESLEANLG